MQMLLDKTRRMNQLLSRAASDVDFHGSARVIRDTLDCNAYILDTSGRVLGYALMDDFDCKVMKEDVLKQNEFPPTYNDRLFIQRETVANVHTAGVCVFKEGIPCVYKEKLSTSSRWLAEAKGLARWCLQGRGGRSTMRT
jgi:transcriptional pleiotropic repressor